MPAWLPMTSWSWWSCSCSKPSDVVDDMPDDEAEPDYGGEQHGQPLAHAVVLRVAGILPEVPVRRQNPHADGDRVLLDFKEALRLPVARLFDRDAHIDAVLGVDPRAHDKGDNPQDAHRGGITRRRHRAEAVDEIA